MNNRPDPAHFLAIWGLMHFSVAMALNVSELSFRFFSITADMNVNEWLFGNKLFRQLIVMIEHH